MPTRLLTTLSIVSLVLLLTTVESARAAGSHSSGLLVDGYTVTMTEPTTEAQTGRVPIVVTLHDARQQPLIGATVNATLLAYLPAEEGHGATHGAADPTDNQSADHAPAAQSDSAHATIPGMADMPGMSHSDTESDTAHAAMPGMADMSGMTGMVDADHTHGDTAPASVDAGHDHGAASPTEGQGLAPAPVLLQATDVPGRYQGTLSFDRPGTWTIGIAFTVAGQEHGTTVDLAVTQSRPRGLVLGGFALLNGLVIGVAAVLRRTPRKPARSAPVTRSASPVSSTATTEEQPQ